MKLKSIIFFSLLSFKIFSQDLNILFTDKEIYTSTNKILFLIISIDLKTNTLDTSNKTIYCELINHLGKIIQTKKFKNKNGYIISEFNNLDTLLCGKYYLRCYSNISKNYINLINSYKEIYIFTNNSKIYDYQSHKEKKDIFEIFLPDSNFLSKNFYIINSDSSQKIKIQDTVYKKQIVKKRLTTNNYIKKGLKKFHLKNRLEIPFEIKNKNENIEIYFDNDEDNYILLYHNKNLIEELAIKDQAKINLNDLPNGIIKIIIITQKKQYDYYVYNYYKKPLVKIESLTDSFKIYNQKKVTIFIIGSDDKKNFDITDYLVNFKYFSTFKKFINEEPFNFIKSKNLKYISKFDQNIIDSQIIIKGEIKILFEKIPGKNILLELYDSENKLIGKSLTDNNGKFLFYNIFFYDTTTFYIAINDINPRNKIIELIDNDTVLLDYINQNSKVICNYKYINPKIDNNSIYGMPDYVIFQKDFLNKGYTNIIDVLKGRVSGLYISNNSILIRGPNSITQSNEPLILLDNVPVDISILQDINLNDVERIEIIKNMSNTAIYGQRGANGIISIYTKKGHYINWGHIYLKALGYSKDLNKLFVNNYNKTNPFNIIQTKNNFEFSVNNEIFKNFLVLIFDENGNFTYFEIKK